MTNLNDLGGCQLAGRLGLPIKRMLTLIAFVMAYIIWQAPLVLAQFGTGADGSWTIAGQVNLYSDKNYVDLTVAPGGTLNTNGYTVYVSGTLLNQGRITDLYNGGSGGWGGPGGAGGQGTPSHFAPVTGGVPTAGGSAWKTGGGSGGSGGYGGCGGGGAWRGNGDYAADGGLGGSGGAGGKGGGVVRIYAATLNNWGDIDADGQPGLQGTAGQNGQYKSFTWLFWSCDGSGGGGGGGGGGNGGNGGTVEVYYGTLTHEGAIHAYGGVGGAGKSGGTGSGQSYSANSDEYKEYGAYGWGNGGNGGDSEAGTTSSGPGVAGRAGYNGAARAVTVQHIGCCVGTRGNVNMAGIVDVSDLSMLVGYLTQSPAPTLPCEAAANVNALGVVDVSDLSLLVAYLTASPAPVLPPC